MKNCFFNPALKSIRVRVMTAAKFGIEQMMEAIHAYSRNYIGSNNKLLRHGTGSGKVQVHCASQENTD
jgi:hypothetical protein